MNLSMDIAPNGKGVVCYPFGMGIKCVGIGVPDLSVLPFY